MPYPVFTRAPLVGSLDMDYWCSAFETKGARVNTGYGTPNMFWHLKQKLSRIIFWFSFDFYEFCSRNEICEKNRIFLRMNFHFFEICCSNHLHVNKKGSRLIFWFILDFYKICSKKQVWKKFWDFLINSYKICCNIRYGKGSRIIFLFVFDFYEICSKNQVWEKFWIF